MLNRVVQVQPRFLHMGIVWHCVRPPHKLAHGHTTGFLVLDADLDLHDPILVLGPFARHGELKSNGDLLK